MRFASIQLGRDRAEFGVPRTNRTWGNPQVCAPRRRTVSAAKPFSTRSLRSSASGGTRGRTSPAPSTPRSGGTEKCIFRTCIFRKCIFRKCIFRKFCKFLAGSFSAVSKRNFARKYAFDSIFQALQDLHPFAPLQSQNFRKKSV